MPKLRLSSIICEIPEEDDKDEIYIKFRDKKIWPQKQKFVKVDVDESVLIGLSMPISKTGQLKLELWEYDLASKDDHLGTFHLHVESLEPGHFSELLIRDEQGAKRASYYLNWEIKE